MRSDTDVELEQSTDVQCDAGRVKRVHSSLPVVEVKRPASFSSELPQSTTIAQPEQLRLSSAARPWHRKQLQQLETS